MLLIETSLVLLSLLLAFAWPTLGGDWFEKIERAFSQLARRRGLAVAAVGLTALSLRIAVLPVEPIPEPIVHDEFGYLLAADTFLHGRLTNPTHPMWLHFESFNILQKPTYQSITPPAQGLLLALGKLILGNPFWGVWLSAGLMCAAITWMLQGWVSAEWAMVGGILAILRYSVFGYWANSYWGGAVGAIGGALVLGALPRIQKNQHIWDALLLALGLAILANNRPYEGFILSLPVAVALSVMIFGKKGPRLNLSMRRLVLPVTLVLLVLGTGTAFYFFRVTGNPFRMPYQVERQTYAVAPYLLFQHTRPEPVYHHAVIRKMYVDEELVGYHAFRTPVGMALKAVLAWKFYLGPLLTLPFIVAIFTLPYGFTLKEIDAETRFLLITTGVLTLGCLLESFYAPHYSSPATALALAMVIIALRRVRAWKRKEKLSGLFLSRAVMTAAVMIFLVRAFAGPLGISLNRSISPAWFQRGPESFGRAVIANRLQQMPGNQLVIVHYSPDHEPFNEWVYNSADIDHAKVVWAREMDATENDRLLNYFKDRRVWLLNADAKPPQLLPYPEESGDANENVVNDAAASEGK